MKCVICEKRPGHESGYCTNCEAQLKARRGQKREVFRFVTYRGFAVAFYRNGNGTLKTELTRRNPENLPKTKTLDLNKYIDGFTRGQVKKLKRCILQLANA